MTTTAFKFLNLQANDFSLNQGPGPFSHLAGRDSWDPAIRDILDREWFRRVWIFQELIRSRDPWVQVGQTRVRWDRLCQMIRDLDRSPLHERTKVLEDMNRSQSDKSSKSLFQLLQACERHGRFVPAGYHIRSPRHCLDWLSATFRARGLILISSSCTTQCAVPFIWSAHLCPVRPGRNMDPYVVANRETKAMGLGQLV